MAQSPLIKRLRARAKELGSRVVEEALNSDRRSDAVGEAVRRVQQSRRSLDEGAARVLGALGLATQEDLEHLNRRVGKLRKRLLGILDQLDDDPQDED